MRKVKITRKIGGKTEHTYEVPFGKNGLTELGVTSSIAHFILDGDTDIRVSIDGKECTERFYPSNDDLREARQSNQMQELLDRAFGH